MHDFTRAALYLLLCFTPLGCDAPEQPPLVDDRTREEVPSQQELIEALSKLDDPRTVEEFREYASALISVGDAPQAAWVLEDGLVRLEFVVDPNPR